MKDMLKVKIALELDRFDQKIWKQENLLSELEKNHELANQKHQSYLNHIEEDFSRKIDSMSKRVQQNEDGLGAQSSKLIDFSESINEKISKSRESQMDKIENLRSENHKFVEEFESRVDTIHNSLLPLENSFEAFKDNISSKVDSNTDTLEQLRIGTQKIRENYTTQEEVSLLFLNNSFSFWKIFLN